MRVALRIALALLALLAVALGALALLLPGIVRSDAVRLRIEQVARDALGREVGYADLDFALLPPSLVVREPSLAGPAPGSPPLAVADRVVLRIALAPLLARVVVVDSLVVAGATVRLRRTAEGLELPAPQTASGAAAGDLPAPGSPPAGEADEASSGVVDLAVRSLSLRDARILLEDLAVEPSVTWELRDLQVDARATSLSDPIALEASARLDSGGTLEAGGTATLEGSLDLVVRLADVALSPAQPYLGRGSELEGTLRGRVALRGTAGSPLTSADLTLSQAVLRLDEIGLQGEVGIRAELAGSDGPTGSFDLDATAAELRYGPFFTKPPGTRARLSGRVVPGAGGGLDVDDLKLHVKDFEAQGKVSLGPPARVELRTETETLDGWDALLPARGGLALAGPFRIERLVLVSEPTRVSGAIQLQDVSIQPPDLPPIRVQGTLRAVGAAVESEGLSIVAAEQVLGVRGGVRELFGTPRYRFDLAAQDADTNALVTAFAGKPDLLFGPLDLSGHLEGTIGGERSPIEALRGKLAVEVREGRLVGVSLLESAFESLGAGGGTAAVAAQLGRAFAGSGLQRFYGEEFESIRGALRIADGVATADSLELLYRDYAVALWGDVGLLDLALDMEGEITLFEDVDRALAEQAGARSARGRRRTIPLASVQGTLDSPEVKVTPEVALRLASVYLRDAHAEKAKEWADEKVGEGAGDVLDGLLDIFGGTERR